MKKLAIIGGSYLQEPLVLKAKEMGIETHCFSWEEGATCKQIADFFYPISIIEKELILKKCQEIGINGITSIASDIAVPTVCFVAEKMNLIGNTYLSSQITTNKYLMRNRLLDFKVNCPRFTIADLDYSVEKFKYPIIVKPTDRSGSRGVYKIEKKEDIVFAVDRAKELSFSNEVIIEEFISGLEISVESISWQGKHYILAITDKVTTDEPYFVEIEHHQPSQLSVAIQERVEVETKKALSALGIDYGASHSEFKITDDGSIYIIEVGARMGGDFIGSDLVKYSTGYDFVKGVIEIALGIFTEPVQTIEQFAGVYFLSKQTKFIKQYIKNKIHYPEIKVATITSNQLSEIQCSTDRSGFLIYQATKKMRYD